MFTLRLSDVVWCTMMTFFWQYLCQMFRVPGISSVPGIASVPGPRNSQRARNNQQRLTKVCEQFYLPNFFVTPTLTDNVLQISINTLPLPVIFFFGLVGHSQRTPPPMSMLIRDSWFVGWRARDISFWQTPTNCEIMMTHDPTFTFGGQNQLFGPSVQGRSAWQYLGVT